MEVSTRPAHFQFGPFSYIDEKLENILSGKIDSNMIRILELLRGYAKITHATSISSERVTTKPNHPRHERLSNPYLHLLQASTHV